MATIGIVSDHLGQMYAALAVAKWLQALGHGVSFFLHADGPAAKSYLQHCQNQPSNSAQVGFDSLKLVPVIHRPESPLFTEDLKSVDVVLVTLSPARTPNLELSALDVAKRWGVPIYGYAEVPCGHMATLWRNRLAEFDGFFAAKVTSDLHERFGNGAWEVGPRLDHLRGIDRQAVGSAAKAALGMGVDDPWVWCSGGPYPEAVEVLRHVVETMVSVKYCHHPDRFRRLTLVVTRHGRDEQHERAKEIAQDYWAVLEAAGSSGLNVIENSPGHGRQLPSPRFAAISPVSHTEMFCGLHFGGVLVTGHGTDGLNAPYCSYPSILCNASAAFDPDMLSEKGVHRFPLEEGCPYQVGTQDDLADALQAHLTLRPLQRFYASFCERHYPFPKYDAGECVAQKLHRIVTGS